MLQMCIRGVLVNHIQTYPHAEISGLHILNWNEGCSKDNPHGSPKNSVNLGIFIHQSNDLFALILSPIFSMILIQKYFILLGPLVN